MLAEEKENGDRDVAEVVGCSHRDVARVKQAITVHGVESAAAVSDAELLAWFPDGRRRVSAEYDQPDLGRVLASMRQNRHFTLLLAWRRYRLAISYGCAYTRSWGQWTGRLRCWANWYNQTDSSGAEPVTMP